MADTRDMNVAVVIMAGGIGTRFWPVSTREYPKQFVKLLDDRSLLQRSLENVTGLVEPERVLVLTNACFAALCREQLPELPPDNIIGEPMRRDTAAAVCLGALAARRRFGAPVVATLTADHVIEPRAVFQRALASAAEQAHATGALYTFGIRPAYPATGYGYLELGEKTCDDNGVEHFRVARFKEKPDAATARGYVESGRYLWNSGMFVWRADAILEELQRQAPGHVAALSRAVACEGTPEWPGALEAAFAPLERVSIDYAVMERARDVRCVAGTFAWKDLGGWLSMRDYLERDAFENCVQGAVHVLDAADNVVFCEAAEETVALIGVRDLVVVRCGARTLIAHKDHIERVKQLVEDMDA